MLKKERFSAYSHLVGLTASVVGSVVLVWLARNSPNMIVTSVYGFSICLLFAASFFYHSLKKKEDEYSLWRILDHIAIFFMIAGTYTPIAFIYLDGAWKWGIIIAQWSIVGLSLILTPFILDLPRWVEVGMYISMGWMAVLPFKQLIANVPISSLMLVLAGGLSFTIGAIIHSFNKDKPIPGIFEFHDIWHLFVLLGGSLHYTAIYIAVASSF